MCLPKRNQSFLPNAVKSVEVYAGPTLSSCFPSICIMASKRDEPQNEPVKINPLNDMR